MRRDHSKIIFRTVVFAGAMLGGAACGGKKKPDTIPQNTSTNTQDPNANTTNTNATTPDPNDPNNPCNPCNPCRPRGGDDEEGGMGRGFILS